MKRRHAILAALLFFASQNGRAQFTLNGSAMQVNDTCWQLTPAQFNQVGSIWNEQKISLDESFNVIMDLNFGNKDADGADGILFGFQPISTSIGEQGGGLGFANVTPSIGIEFDTWQNDPFNDPPFDHVAIIQNGNVVHGSPDNLAGPVQASAAANNIEDGQWHRLWVNWDAPGQTLQVWFDCVFRLAYTGDVVNNIFGGDPEVFWGFTAATGGSVNVQQVCLSYTTFLDGFEDVVICPGGQLQLQVSGGSAYHWTPATGLSDPDVPDPIAAPAETTTYIVEVSDPCISPFFDTITVFIDGDTVFFDLGPDTTLCQGLPLHLDAASSGTDTVAYFWSNGATSPAISPSLSGTYAVTVTIDDYCRADDRVQVNFIPLPGNGGLGPDTTLCPGQSLLLDATTPGSPEYQWADGTTGPFFPVSGPGRYSVHISNMCGEGTANIDVFYEDCRQVFFPSVFSPNGDGINDVFLPFDGGDVATVRHLKIFDRWGGLVFENHDFLPNDFAAGWAGEARGETVSPGLYVWVAEVVFRDGLVEVLAGEMGLVR